METTGKSVNGEGTEGGNCAVSVPELRAEIERLRTDADALAIGWNKASEEIERLRAALAEIRSLNDSMDPDVEDVARRALGGK